MRVGSQRDSRPRRSWISGCLTVHLCHCLAVATTLGSLVVLGCDRRSEEGSVGANVVLLVLDGLRVDTSKPIEEVLSAVLDTETNAIARAYAPSSLSQQSLASVFAGRLPTFGGSIGLVEAQPAEQATTLATRFRGHGYRTGFVSQASWAARPGFTRGFSELQVAADDGWDDGQVADKALQIVGDWSHLSGEERAPSARSLLVVHWQAPSIDSATVPTPAAAHKAYGAFVDERSQAVGRLLEGLDSVGFLDSAFVVVTSGHGYELREHGAIGSGWTLHEEVVRVPLLLHGPAGAAALAVDEIVSTREIFSLSGLGDVIADLVGLDDDGEQRAMATSEAAGDSHTVISELVIRERTIQRAVIEVASREAGHPEPPKKYLRVLREVPLADREAIVRGYEELQAAMLSGAIEAPAIFGEAQRELLFSLSENPSELTENTVELSGDRQAVSRLRAFLRAYQRRCEAEGWAPAEVTERLEINVEDAAELETLGYL